MILKQYCWYFLLMSLFICCGSDTPEEPEPPTEQPEEKPEQKPEEKPELVTTPYTIPLWGNTYLTTRSGNTKIGEKGIESWNSSAAIASTFFKLSGKGKLNVAIIGASPEGKSDIKVTIAGTSFTLPVTSKTTDSIYVGEVTLPTAGYVRVDMQGVNRTGSTFGTVSALKIGGEAANGTIIYVPTTNDWPYWGRRGPSVHMGYTLPTGNVQYFYNEVTVPKDNDVMNSYFMSNGFGQGYMGMQVNSETERRVLFSVWSPYETDRPGDIPAEYRIELLRQGKDVKVNDFGNEGSGAQSFLIYPWEAGKTYKFLTEVKPAADNSTDYTAYFCGHDNRWRLIASFRRPHTTTWYTGAHSFLENFNPEMGYAQREVYFDNQWARMADGTWQEMVNGKFTYDATASAGIRLDYAGGLKEGKFFLKNCGFFNENTKYQSVFTRPAKGSAPQIDFKALEELPSIH